MPSLPLLIRLVLILLKTIRRSLRTKTPTEDTSGITIAMAITMDTTMGVNMDKGIAMDTIMGIAMDTAIANVCLEFIQ